MKDYRCPHCKNLLFKAVIAEESRINIKCKRCKKIVDFTGVKEKENRQVSK